MFFRPTSQEYVLIITEKYEVRGTVFNFGFSRKKRVLSDLLNKANKNFIAVKDCEITYNDRQGETEKFDFYSIIFKYIINIYKSI